ncbi:hypothetical protein Bpla01_23080 [Burkholderia plantarii]|nr:hypothetical protein Bpla01_23080 [Burkholderia plantarii]
MGAARPSADATFRRAAWRFMPLLFIRYAVAYLDRVNVGFATPRMPGDLHVGEAVYGFGAGLFFVGYFFLEVPSNLLLHRPGARRWIARIMVGRAVLSLATAWVSTPATSYAARLPPGVAEAGFFPGMIPYLACWLSSHRRGRMTAVLMAGNPVSGIVVGPRSGFIMHAFDGAAGHAGWRWREPGGDRTARRARARRRCRCAAAGRHGGAPDFPGATEDCGDDVHARALAARRTLAQRALAARRARRGGRRATAGRTRRGRLRDAGARRARATRRHGEPPAANAGTDAAASATPTQTQTRTTTTQSEAGNTP